MAIPISVLKGLLTQGAVQGGRRAITGSGGKVLRSGVQAGAQQAAQGGGLLAGAGGLISSYAIFDLIGDLLGGASRTATSAVPALTNAVTGNNPNPVANPGVGSQKYAVPQVNPLDYQQYYNEERYRRELLSRAGIDLGPLPARPLTQMEAYNLNQLAMQRAGERERELARVQGELAALPAAFQTQGQIGQSTAGILNQAIATVLQRAPVEKSQALQAIATKQQF